MSFSMTNTLARQLLLPAMSKAISLCWDGGIPKKVQKNIYYDKIIIIAMVH
jgi:hypothetical protein